MLGFAGIAVLVGIFLIVNTFSMLIAQRTRELGLLRALGADRRQVRRSVLTEALLLGLVGSTLGLAAGIGLAAGLIELMGLLGMNLERRRDGGRLWRRPCRRTSSDSASPSWPRICRPGGRRGSRRWRRSSDAEVAGVGRPLRMRAVVGRGRRRGRARRRSPAAW